MRKSAGQGHKNCPVGGGDARQGQTSRLGPTNASVRFPKDLTRTTSGLLAFRWSEEILMLRLKTHFEQVPLEIVRKIVEEQIRREIASKQDQGTMQRTLEDLFGMRKQRMVNRSTLFQVEVWK